MPTLIYQAVCYTHSRYLGPATTDHQQAYQDEQAHLAQFPDDNVDIQITQSFGMTGQTIDPDTIAPFDSE